MTEKKGLSRAAKIALALVGLGAVSIPCIGVTMALALPAMDRYYRRSRTLEARAQLEALRSSIDAAAALPPSLPPTPPASTLGTEPRPWPADADPGWTALGFSPLEPLRYSYAVTTDPMLGTVRIEATGDLDGDGFHSSFTRSGHLLGGGPEVLWDEVVVIDELE